MSIRVAHVSDLHLNFSAQRLGNQKIIDGKNVYYQERLTRFQSMIDTAVSAHVDAIVISGDLHDKPRPVPQEYDDTKRILDRVPATIPVLAIAGNHDEVTAKGSPVSMLADWRPHITVVSQCWRYMTFPKFTVLLAAWGADYAEISSFLTELPRDPLPRFLVGHLAVTGTNITWGEVEGEVGTILLQDLTALPVDAILLGHHHEQRLLAPNCWYAGSSEVFTFGEADQRKGWIIADVEPGRQPILYPQTEAYPRYITATVQQLLDTDPALYEEVYLRIRGEVSQQSRPLLLSLLRTLPVAGFTNETTFLGRSRPLTTLTGKSPDELLKTYLTEKGIPAIQKLLELDRTIARAVQQGDAL